jgi:hypothetical protein
MDRTFAATIALSLLAFGGLRAQDVKFVAENLKYSRDFYAKVHFVAVMTLPQQLKYDRYPLSAAERIQCDEGTYLREHGKAWRRVDQKMRAGLPIDYAETARYVMTQGYNGWGQMGEPVPKGTALKVDGWIKLIDAALNVAPATVKLTDKSEQGRGQWIFESPNSDGPPIRLTFRKRPNDKNKNVLLHEFSGSMRLDGDKVVTAGAANPVKMGFGYMMNVGGTNEVSEFAWEEMQQSSGGAQKK